MISNFDINDDLEDGADTISHKMPNLRRHADDLMNPKLGQNENIEHKIDFAIKNVAQLKNDPQL